VLYGVLIEVLQPFIGRSGDNRDAMADVLELIVESTSASCGVPCGDFRGLARCARAPQRGLARIGPVLRGFDPHPVVFGSQSFWMPSKARRGSRARQQ